LPARGMTVHYNRGQKMGWSYSHTFRVVSIAVLFFFLWTFGGLFDVAFAVKSRDQKSGVRGPEKSRQNKIEKKLNRAIDTIEQIITDRSLDITSKKDRLKTKKTEIEILDKEIRERFADTEQKLRDAGLPERILKRHEYFVEKYNHNFNELRNRLDAVNRAVDECQINAEIERIKIHLDKLKPPKKQKRFNPDTLPHRKAEPVKVKPRMHKDSDKQLAISGKLQNQIPPYSPLRKGGLNKSGQHTAVSSRQAGQIPLSLGDALLSLWMTEGDLKGGPEDGLLLTAFNSQLEEDSPPFLKGGEGGLQTDSILVAANGSLEGVLSDEALLSTELSAFSDRLSALVFNSELITQDSFILAQTSDPPTSDDLAETIEVQFTPAITEKAAELGHDPVRIYNWVRNNVGFVATYGSIQGADMCLLTQQCNAFDTSSLLIALLRASNIHARYVEGTVEVPIEKIMNWVGGFTDAKSALDLMAAGGIPTGGITSGGKIVKARFEHIWVEAWVDYIPYRGAVHEQGDTWIPLDASFKQYNYTNRLDVDTAVPRDVDALWAEVESQSIIDPAIPSITGMPSAAIQGQLTDFLTQLSDHIAISFPEVHDYYSLNKTLHGDRQIMSKEIRFLPNSLEAKVIVKLKTYSELPDALRHKISFDLGSENFSYENSITYTTSLPEIAGKRITLSYTPATPDDAEVMSNAESVLDFPAYLVKVIPELKIEGQTVAAGESIGMGQSQLFQIAFSNPHNMLDRIDNIIQAGEYYAVGLNVNNISFQYLYDRTNNWQPDSADERDDRLGELLHIAAMFHFARLDHFMDELSRSSNIVNLRHPSESMAGMSFHTDYLFDTPTIISSVELNMDVDRDVIYPASRTHNKDTEAWFMVQKGLYSSNLEHFAFEELTGFDSVSTVRLLNLANQQNVPIYSINNENSYRVGELQISSGDRQDIMNAIYAGKTVVVPKTEIQYIDYSGIGYAVVDSETGAGAYMISGGLSGGSTAIKDGETVKERVKELVDLGQELLGKKGKYIGSGYKITILYILSKYPHIADSSATEFPEFDVWSRYVLNFKDIKDCESCDVRIKAIMGQQILYYTIIMAMDITDPVY